MAPTTPPKKVRIKELHSEGKENVYIADKVGIHKSTVGRILSKMEEHPDLYYQASHGHQKRILGDRDMPQAEQMLNSGQARDGADVWKELFPDVSSPTVHRRVNEYGLEGHVRAEKPYLSARHMWGERALVAEFKNWEEKDWDAVVFSDESKFQLFGSDGKRYCRRRKGDRYKESQSAEVNIIEPVWGHLDKQVHKSNPLPRNLDELWDALKEEWDNLDTEYITNLYHSIPHRLQAVRDAKGSYTKY